MFRILDNSSKSVLVCGLACAMFAPFASASAGSYSVVYTFKGGSDGSSPYAGLIADTAGNLYSTTNTGGTNNSGTVFKLAPDGTKTVVYTFTGGSDGANPEASLIMDKTGNLYGTAFDGGTQSGSSGIGTVFKLTPAGSQTVLHTFTYGTDGGNPQDGLLSYKKIYYGTTEVGGASGNGTVFKLTPSGTETVLYSFATGTDGANPFGGLIVDAAGNFYGTTEAGGATGNGTVFKVAQNGTETVLYSFKGGSDGQNPYGALVKDSAGNFYSTTYYGGGTGCGGLGCGTVFKLAPSGTETVVHAFAGGSDGMSPEAGLVKDAAGNLYGTTFQGGGKGCGSLGCGTVFKIAANGAETVLHAFAGGSDGSFPTASLIAKPQGYFSGTTLAGGASNSGTVFKVPK
jgi:uncharacterized repeat protein (TIGR03803 family)